MKDNYIFPAVFHVDEEGVSVCFPDLPGCLTCADTMEEAFVRAKEAVQLHLYGMEEDAEEIPSPTSLMEIKTSRGETIGLMSNKATNKTVTIPRWLDILARREKVNYSHLLQSALKSYLGVTENPSQSMRA